MTPSELSDRLWHFGARVSKVVDALPDTRTGRHVAAQLIRCGTSAAPNYDDGRVAESRADFAHKLNIALKEMVNAQCSIDRVVDLRLACLEAPQLVRHKLAFPVSGPVGSCPILA